MRPHHADDITSQDYGAKGHAGRDGRRPKLDAYQELVALGLANLGAAFTGDISCPVAGENNAPAIPARRLAQ